MDASQIVALVCQCGTPLLLIALGFTIGRMIENSHLRELDRREAELAGCIATNLRSPPAGHPLSDGHLVTGGVVIGSDYFKTFAASLRKLIGGEVRSFERMMHRARREAMVRMLEQAHALGATTVINIRFETCSINGVGTRGGLPMAEVFAYGTALVPRGGATR